MPDGARSSARPFGHAHQPGLGGAVGGEPLPRTLPQHRAGEDQPPALAHHPGRGTGAEERTGEVHLENLPPHRRIGLERSAHDGRDPGVADPDVDAAPLGTVASATASLKSASVTSPPTPGPGREACRRRPISLLRAGHQGHPCAGYARRHARATAQPPAGSGEYHPLSRHVTCTRGRNRGSRSVRPSPFPALVPTSTVHRSWIPAGPTPPLPPTSSPTPTSSRCIGGCW